MPDYKYQGTSRDGSPAEVEGGRPHDCGHSVDVEYSDPAGNQQQVVGRHQRARAQRLPLRATGRPDEREHAEDRD